MSRSKAECSWSILRDPATDTRPEAKADPRRAERPTTNKEPERETDPREQLIDIIIIRPFFNQTKWIVSWLIDSNSMIE